jgi:sugar/nucleoside kinase (ribokinase family)
LISIDDQGDNSIIVAPGANKMLMPADLRKREDMIKQANQFASAIGAITVTRMGAQSSMPNLDEVELFMKTASNQYP